MKTHSVNYPLRFWNATWLISLFFMSLHFTACETGSDEKTTFEPGPKTITLEEEDPLEEEKKLNRGFYLNSTHFLKDGPYLRLDSQGHTSRPTSLAYSTDQTEIYTTGFDKIIHVWNAEDGRWLRTLRTPLAKRLNGSHWALDVAPGVADKPGQAAADVIAIGGFGIEKLVYPIWLLDSASGSILATAHGHFSTVSALEFSKDHRFLATGSYDKQVRIWKFQPDKDPSQRLESVNRDSPALGTMPGIIRDLAWSEDGKHLVVVADQGSPRIFTSNNDQANNWRGKDAEFIISGDDSGWEQVEIIGDRFFIVSSGGNMFAGSLSRKQVDWKVEYALGTGKFGAIRSGGNYLAAQWLDGKRGSYPLCLIEATSLRSAPVTLKQPDNRLGAIAWDASSTRLAAIGGASPDLLRWDLNQKSTEAGYYQRTPSFMNPVGELDLQLNSQLAYLKITPKQSSVQQRAQYQEPLLMNLRLMEPVWEKATAQSVKGGNNKVNAGKQIVIENEALFFEQTVSKKRKKWEPNSENAIPSDKIVYDATWVDKDENLLALATPSGLIICTDSGEIIDRPYDHEGEVLHVESGLFYPDKESDKGFRILVSGGQDGIVNIYQLSSSRLVLKLSLCYQIHPEFGQREWIIWTPEGKYKSSPGGSHLIGWHYNNGLYEKPDFFKAFQFRSRKEDPDWINKRLGTVVRAPDSPESENSRPIKVRPRIQLENPIVTESTIKNAKFELDAGTNAVEQIVLMVNGAKVRIFKHEELKYERETKKLILEVDEIPLISGKNKIGLGVLQTDGVISIPDPNSTLNVEFEPFEPQPKKIYGLFVGYNGPDLEFAESDAEQLALNWKKGCAVEINTRVLVGETATRQAVLEAIEDLSKKVKLQDIVVVFLSGHGTRDYKGNFFYETPDIIKEDIEVDDVIQTHVQDRTGLKWSDLLSKMQNVSGRKILLMNSCRSGSVTGLNTKGKNIYQWSSQDARILEDLYDPRFGFVAIAARGPGTGDVIDENPTWGGSAFAKALNESINEVDSLFAGMNQDQYDLYFSTLYARVSEKIRHLTEQKQRPAHSWPNMMEDFSVKPIKL